jgi:hypothetical protein
MTTKATLHQIIEELPESELVAAGRFLAYLLSHDYIACHCLLPFPSQRHARWHIPAVKPDRPLAQEIWKTDGLVFPAGV